MARRPFGGTTADVATDASGDLVVGAQVTIWTAATGGAQLTDLQTPAGVAISGGIVRSDANGIVSFLGPADGTSVVYADGGLGGRTKMLATDLADRVSTLEATPGGGVTSVNTRTGAVTLAKSDVGLGNVDNTSDANKPVSTVQAAADTAVQTAAAADATAKVAVEATARANADALLAPLASPAFTGNPTAPTQTAGNNSTRIATTAFVATAIGSSQSVQYVVHGSTASTARPSTSGPVVWTGSVAPTNAVAGDEWQDTTTNPYTTKIRGSAAFFTLGGSGSGLPSTIQSKTTAYTAAAGDFVLANAASAGFTVTLPSAPATGALVTVKKTDATANVVTVAPAAGGTVDGDANATITSPQFGGVFEHVGSDAWKVVAPTSAGGSNGVNGSTVLNGTGAPSNALGANGDFYIDTTNTRLYGPKAAGAWGSYVSLIGPAGSSSGGGLDLPGTYNPMHRNSSANIGNFGNRVHCGRNTLGSGTISKIRAFVVTSSGNVAVAVYNPSGTGVSAVPGARTAVSSSVPCPAAGAADIALGASVSVAIGDYLALGCDNTTAQFASGGYTSNQEKYIACFQDTYPPPSPAASTTYVDSKQFLLIGVA